MKNRTLSFAKTTALVARALGMAPEKLIASFQPATSRHLPGIIDLRGKVRSVPWDEASYLRWRYDFSGRSDARSRLMVVAHGDRVLGMMGAEAVRLARGGDRLDALSTMDILVDPDLGGAGLGAWLNMALFATSPVVFEIGANPNSLGLIKRLFHMLPNRRQYVAPLRPRRVIARRLQSRIGSVAASIMAAPADVTMSLWRGLVFRRPPASWSVRDLASFDSSVEDLFARRWGPEDIAIERTSGYLNWRLFENPRARYAVLAAYERGEMIAYIAYQSRDDADGTRVFRLVDWLVDDRHGFAGFSLLAQEIFRRALAEGAESVSMSPLHARLERSLWRLGFVARAASRFNTVGVRCRDPVPWPELHDGARWFLTQANSDSD